MRGSPAAPLVERSRHLIERRNLTSISSRCVDGPFKLKMAHGAVEQRAVPGPAATGDVMASPERGRDRVA